MGQNVRRSSLLLIALALAACLPGASSLSAQLGQPQLVVDKTTTSEDWSRGLAVGPNGPIPFIVVDQFGYRPQARKIAVIRDPQAGYDSFTHFAPGGRYGVVDKSSGAIVKSGTPVPWNGGAVDASSGDKVWRFDFSDVTTPGEYTVVDLEKGMHSVAFEIGEGVYRDVLKHAVRMFYYQRAGMAKTPENAGSTWADAASHLGPRQDPETRDWLAKADPSRARDLRGGWYDAGDYNKYTTWGARNVITLLKAYVENPTAFGDDTNIPESGNGVPDILDEVKWELDWLVRMQNADGSVLCVQGLDRASPPSAAKGPSYYGPPTTAATLTSAAAFAFASKIYSARPEAELRRFGLDLRARAEKGWAWANEHPKVLYFNNDEGRQPGSNGLASGQQEMTDGERSFVRFEAAVYLYEITGEAAYGTVAAESFAAVAPPYSVSQWTVEQHDAVLHYAHLRGVPEEIKNRIVSQFAAAVAELDFELPMVVGDKDPYLAPIRDYTWGSNQSKAAQARIYQLFARTSGDRVRAVQAEAAAEGYVNYLHGVNPLGLVYLTNMRGAGAKHSADQMFHFWFGHGSERWSRVTELTPGPPPGYLVGGPNPWFKLDACCNAQVATAMTRCGRPAASARCDGNYSPPLTQPALKSYRQFNDDWPLNSWEVTEPSTAYQANYVRALAPYAR